MTQLIWHTSPNRKWYSTRVDDGNPEPVCADALLRLSYPLNVAYGLSTGRRVAS